jgi:hypothetical protein
MRQTAVTVTNGNRFISSRTAKGMAKHKAANQQRISRNAPANQAGQPCRLFASSIQRRISGLRCRACVAHFIKRQPAGRDNALIQLALRLKTPQLAGKGKTQVGDILASDASSYNTDHRMRRLEMVGRFFQRLARTASTSDSPASRWPAISAVRHAQHGEMTMADRDGFIWQDGKLVPWREATTHVLTHSLHYGMPSSRASAPTRPSRHRDLPPAEHTERLFNSAHIYMMAMPYDKERTQRGAEGSRARQQARILLPAPDRLLRLGKDGRLPKGAKVHVAIAAWPWGAYLGEEGMERGIRVKTSSATPATTSTSR